MTVGASSVPTNQEQATSPPSLDLFFETVHSFYRTESLKAAIKLEVFTVLGEGAETTEAIARRCRASDRGIRILCNFLASIGFIRKDGNRYSLTPDSKIFLDRRSQHYVGDSLEFLLSPTQTEGFRDLASVIQNGRINLPSEGVLAPDHPVWITFARAMVPILGLPADLLASMLLPESHSKLPMNVLDVAAGHGLFGIAIAKRNPNARVVAVDWPNVLMVAQDNAYAQQVAERYTTLPGNALELHFKNEDYDLVLIPNFLHHLDAKTIERLLSKVYGTLKPGGTVAILEFIPNEDRISPAVAVMFSVMMLGTTPDGDAYTFSDYDRILHGVGFSEVKLHQLHPTYFRVVLARK